MRNFLKKNAVWLILILASVLRFKNLAKRDFWYDEAFTGITVKESFWGMIEMTVNDVHPPLYYIFLKGLAYFFNYSVFGIRLFSAIVGVFCVWAVYILSKEILNKKVALYASFITAISPFAIQYSQEARMYTLLSFFILMATYFFVRAIKNDKWSYYFVWGIFVGLAALTHYMGIIYSFVFAILFLYWNLFKENKNGLEEKVKDLIFSDKIYKFTSGFAVAFFVFLPWLPKLIQHMQLKNVGGNLGWVKQASLGDIIYNFQMFIFGTPVGEFSSGMPNPNQILFAKGIVISHLTVSIALTVLITIASIIIVKKGYVKELIILCILSLGFLLIVYLLSIFTTDQQYFVARYLFPSAYVLFIFLGLFLSLIRLRNAVIILVVYMFMIFRIVPLNNSQSYNAILENINKYKGNNFYVLNSFDYVIAKYYFGSDKVILYNFDWPQYNPAACWPNCWASIGPKLKRTENYDDVKNDPKALIIAHKIPSRDTQKFKPDGLEIVDQYSNLMLYKFK